MRPCRAYTKSLKLELRSLRKKVRGLRFVPGSNASLLTSDEISPSRGS
jgi:hypothetical protein